MRSVSLHLATGTTIVDVFAYRGWLFAWTFKNELLGFDVGELNKQLSRQHGDIGLAAAYALFSSRGIGSSPAMRAAWLKTEADIGVEVPDNVDPSFRISFQVPFESVIDFRIYYDQIYLATDLGLYSVALDLRALIASSAESITQRVSGQCHHISTGLGAVSASLGLEGLVVMVNELKRGPVPSKQERLDLVSLRSSIGWGRIANFPNDSDYEFVPHSTIGLDRNKTIDSVRLPESSDLSSAYESQGSNSYTVWSRGRLLNVSSSGVESFGKGLPGSGHRAVAAAANPTPPISAAVTGNRWIAIEAENSVSIVREDDVVKFDTGPVISMRTFPDSWRYQRLITATTEDGVWLFAGARWDQDEVISES